jgi:hypothetical protein
MRAYDTSYFCSKGNPPLAHISSLYGYKKPQIVVYINPDGDQTGKPSVTLHIDGEQDLINFKNSVLEAYEAYERGKKQP